jgi:hypothetical protein
VWGGGAAPRRPPRPPAVARGGTATAGGLVLDSACARGDR